MVIVHLSGGFGNQLFSYAFGYSVAALRQEPLVIDSSIQDEKWFFRDPDILEMEISYDKRLSYGIKRDLPSRAILNRIRYRNAIGWFTKELREEGLQGSPEEIREACVRCPAKDIYLRGNWQREPFFSNFSNDIKTRFNFKKEMSSEPEELKRKLQENPNSVAVHYRRGDYVRIGVSPSPDYFVRAMEDIAKNLGNPEFYVFTEDAEWVKEQFASLPYMIHYPEYSVQQGESRGITDFRLILSASHQIISNSSYSWWAAWLNPNPEKQVCYPYQEGHPLWDKDFGAEGWKPFPFTMLPKE